MAKEDHKTHIWILSVHVIVLLAILVTYLDIRADIKEVRTVDLPEIQNQIIQAL